MFHSVSNMNLLDVVFRRFGLQYAHDRQLYLHLTSDSKEAVDLNWCVQSLWMAEMQ